MRPALLSRATGVIAIAATYLSFLLWDQFGFLRLLESRGLEAPAIQLVLGAMGIAGLVGSFGTAVLLRRFSGRRLVQTGLLASVGATLLPFAGAGLPLAVVAGAAIGLATATLTVSLAATLRELASRPRFGLQVGLGTGLGYALANVPALFTGSPALQAAAVVIACGGAFALLRTRPVATGEEPVPLVARGLLRSWGLAAVLLAFLALVWLDSAAFAIIQTRPDLAALSWGAGAGILGQGAAHLAGAVLAGVLLDAGWLAGTLVLAAALFAVSLPALEATPFPGVGILYAVGIALYSTALVAFPSSRADEPGLVPTRWRAALLYGLGGWVGSALGVGMAQDLERIPGALVLVTLAVTLAVPWIARPRTARWLVQVYGGVLAVGSVALLVPVGAPARVDHASLPSPELGRQVYVAEGCINCHSQYVRPNVGEDLELWGPARPVGDERPVLIGTRRQGPDLSNVGARRDLLWLRRHFEAPRLVSPGSSMPSYTHLFAAGDPRGESLLAYLSSLGSDTRRAAHPVAVHPAGAG